MTWLRTATLASASLALLLAGTGVHGDDVVDGERVYNARCYFCHGYSGDAKTVAASYLSPPPRDFTAESSRRLGRERLLQAVRHGRPGTAMQGFSGLLDETQIAAVVDYVLARFVASTSRADGYHSVGNGWTGDPLRSPAAAFATGAIALSHPVAQLSERQRRGRALFLSTCVTCHARGALVGDETSFRNEAVTFPVGNYVEHGEGEHRPATAVFDRHDVAPELPLTARERRGARVYGENCAACHAADGSGRNWTGSFLDPAPQSFLHHVPGRWRSAQALYASIRDGEPGTSMPAWRQVLDGHDIVAVTAYLVRAFPRFREATGIAVPGLERVPDRRSRFQDSGNGGGPSPPLPGWKPQRPREDRTEVVARKLQSSGQTE